MSIVLHSSGARRWLVVESMDPLFWCLNLFYAQTLVKNVIEIPNILLRFWKELVAKLTPNLGELWTQYPIKKRAQKT